MFDLPLTFLKRPANPSTPKPWLLVLMHGLGSNEQDLFALATQFPERYYVISLRAPHRQGPGAFAWYDFSLDPGGARGIDEAQEAHSRAVLAQAIETAARETGIPPERVVVGGFSQGGTMALSLLLTRPELMHACIVWHGRLLAQTQALQAQADAFHGRKLWVSAGLHDDVVPRSSAQAISHHFDTLPVGVTYREFSSGHEIRPSELAQTLAWLEGLSTTPSAF